MQLDIVLIKDKRRNPILNVIFEIIWLQVVWSWFQKIIVFMLGIIAIELYFGIREDWNWHLDVWVVGGRGTPPPKNAYPLTIQHIQLIFDIFTSKSGKHEAYHGKHHDYLTMVCTLTIRNWSTGTCVGREGHPPSQKRLPAYHTAYSIENLYIYL